MTHYCANIVFLLVFFFHHFLIISLLKIYVQVKVMNINGHCILSVDAILLALAIGKGSLDP